MGENGLEVRCPKCQYFVVRVLEGQTKLDLNCPNMRCPTSIRVEAMNGKLAVTANERKKKA